MISIVDTKIEDIKIIIPQIFSDNRGYFFESYNEDQFVQKIGKVNFIQDNESKSTFGVLRGLHYQDEPNCQSKLVRVIKGEIQDIAVDIRKESKTYLEYISVNLSSKNKKQLYIPKGFAHGFLVLSSEAIVCYKVDNYFDLKLDKGIRYNDPQININWKLSNNQIKLSDKDKLLPLVNQI
tara:strand:- start:676 stop:1215 length:540 start_codon:yes stop_codon:yes gene_type:complete